MQLDPGQEMPAMTRARTFGCVLVTMAILVAASSSFGEDWPTYRHDNSRSGRSAERIDAARLQQSWVWRSPSPPRPAWGGPAMYDAYHGVNVLSNTRDYDVAFRVTVAAGRLYFGSSADDSVHCLDVRTGKEQWSHTTGGPVRIPPTIAGGKAYFGSDDGHAYCVDARGGKPLWKFRPSPRGRRIINDGRFIPRWPCRTGVLIDGGTAYFAAGMLPWHDTYLCAVDAATGKPEGQGRYVTAHKGLSLEGALVANAVNIFAVQGRTVPAIFNRADGKSLGGFARRPNGGSFFTLTEDGRSFHGTGTGPACLFYSNTKTRVYRALTKGGRAVVVSGKAAYLLTGRSLSALERFLPAEEEELDRKYEEANKGKRVPRPRPLNWAKKTLWTKPCSYPYSIILAGDVLFVGGLDKVAAFRARDGQVIWKGSVAGMAHSLAVADGALFVSTHEGSIHCFRPGSAPAAKASAGAASSAAKPPPAKQKPKPLDLAAGPYAQFAGPSSVIVRWETKEPTPTVLDFGGVRIEEAAPKTKHEARATGLRPGLNYDYYVRAVVKDQQYTTGKFSCDNFFNYTPRPAANSPGPFPEDENAGIYADAARHILDATGVRRGICLVLGSGAGRLAFELAKRSDLRVVGVETDQAKVDAARRRLMSAGIYGSRITVHKVESLSAIPFVGEFANLIVSERVLTAGECPGTAAEAARLLRPGGGVLCLGQPASAPKKVSMKALTGWLETAAAKPAVTADANGVWARYTRPPFNGIGVWSHQYGTAANCAYGGESLGGARTAAELSVQWVGRPGPRYQLDRSGRKPSPLSTNGRLFCQGRERVLALDAYNGTILWSLEVPGITRVNIPADCSNWCADDDHVFLAVRDKCWQIDAVTGRVSRLHDVVRGPNGKWAYEWGYVARQGGALVGTAKKAGSTFLNFWGRPGWYDGPGFAKVCSDNLFVIEKASGKLTWKYTRGVIINATICISGNAVYFVECRNAKMLASPARLTRANELWQDRFLVALDLRTGKKLWEKSQADRGPVGIYHIAASGGYLVMVENAKHRYNTVAFDASNGRELWRQVWPGGGYHGQHMSRPGIVKDKVFVPVRAFELKTGKVITIKMPQSWCGSFALADNVSICRRGTVALADLETFKHTGWLRLRPSCWLSTIPAAGMLLSPEGGGGCGCIGWLQTSIAFKPNVRAAGK